MFSALVDKGFDVHALHHSEAILTYDIPEAILDIESILRSIQLPIQELVCGGGGEGQLTQRIRHALESRGWRKHNYEIKKVVDGNEKESISHEIDHVKDFELGTVALETEWNNKDPFFDRDLENFKRLHAEGIISVGGIITRGSTLQDNLKEIIHRFALDNEVDSVEMLSDYYVPTPRQERIIAEKSVRYGSFQEGWANAFVSDKFGEATTHWRKLDDRVRRGVGNPCPLILIGIPDTIVVRNS
jgi:hypothetical protein